MDGLVAGLNILAGGLADTSYALIVGVLLANRWLRSAGGATEISDCGVRCIGTACAAVLVFCHLIRPWFVASSMSGSTEFGQTLALIPTILSSTRQGGVWYTNTAALAVLLGAQFVARAGHRPLAEWSMTTALCVLAATKAASSHASEEGDLSPAEVSQFLHLLATSAWAGAIVVSSFLIVPRLAVSSGLPTLWAYVGHLSATVTWALGILILSGTYTAWSDMHGAFHTLWTSAWGRILLSKVALVGLALILGSLTRFRFLAHPHRDARASLMVRLLRSEAVVMLVILSISALLGNINPGV